MTDTLAGPAGTLAVPPGPGACGGCAHRLFEASARRGPDAPAAVFAGAALTYAELDARANRLARRLRARGVAAEGRVAVVMERGPELPIALLAVLKAGGAYVPVDAEYPDERLRYVLDDCGAALVLADARGAARVGGDARLLRVDAAELAAAPDDAEALGDTDHPEALAYVIYTSGSTGRPKGVGVTHAALGSHNRAVVERYGLTAADRVAQIASLGFDISVEEIFPTWAAGGAVVFRPAEVPSYGAGFLRWLADEGVTVLNVPTAFWHAWVADLDATGAALPPSLRLLVTGGEKALPAALAQWRRITGGRIRWLNSYGPTEATVTATVHEPAGPAEGEVPIGRPMENTRVYILGPDLLPVGPGGEGELFIAGAAVARGYLGRPSLTAERFLPDPFTGTPGARLYRSGDRARMREDGEVEFLGRLDEQVKVGGFRVEPGEVEAVLAEHPSVAQAAVVAREYDAGMRLVGYVVPRGAAALDETALRRWLRERLPGYMVPSAVVALAEMPLTAHAKVDRRALPAPAALAPVEPGYAAPRTPTQEALAEVWAEVLGRPRVGEEDDFFDLGGHSLLGMQVLSRVRQRLGVELPVRAVFEAPTLAALAARIDAAREQAVLVPHPPLRPARRNAPVPLSFAQQRLWFLHQLEPESPFYNIPFAVRMSGALDVAALRRALAEMVRRHEALRTVFRADAEGAVQVVEPAPDEVPLPLADLRAFPRDWAEGEVLRLMADEAETPFDLRRGPLLRALLIRAAEDEHVLSLNLHHVAGDGWSIGIVFRELAALYAAFREGRRPGLPPLEVQYADFAVWQREWLRGPELDRQLAYWRQRLAGAPATLELPSDRPRPAVQSHRGEVRSFAIQAALAGRLRALARRLDATPFMVLLAGFKLLVHRLSGRDDLVVGSPIAGRVRREVEGLIGFFVNTMALRTDLSGDPTFAGLIRRVRETTLEAYAHQDLPFERVVEELQPERTLSHNPLFQVAFALQNVAMDPVSLPGLRLRLEDVDSGTSKFDMFLEVVEEHDAYRGNLEYATDLWEPASVDRMIALFLRLLEEMADDPERPVSRSLRLDGMERRRVTEGANRTARPYDRGGTVHAAFARAAQASPERVALAWDGGAMTYAELHARSSRLAGRLRALGVGIESPVAVAAERSPELVVALLAVLKAGGAYVPVNPRYPRSRISMMLEDSGARVLLVQPAVAGSLPEHALETVVLDAAAGEGPEGGRDPAAETGADAAAYVIYTSGSTGRPKGVVVPHRAVLRLVQGAGFARMEADDTWLQLAPVAFDASTLELWAPLLNGGRLAIFPPELPSMESLGGFIRRHGVTSAWLTAGLFHQMVDASLPALGGLRQLLAGGDVLSVPHVRRVLEAHPHLRLINGYGPTENTTFSCCHTVLADDAERASIPIGRPVSNSTAYVLGPALDPVPLDVPGELFVGGDGVARGYLGRPALTAEKYVPDPFSRAPGARMYRTGDRVRRRADGTIEFLGRMDEQVKIRGHRIEPGEVEAVLARRDDVAAAVVDVREDAPGDRRLVAYVVPARPDAAESAAPAEGQERQVAQWEALFDDVYHGTRGTESGDETFDIIGWNSSYTGQPIPEDEMREWVDRTVERILALNPLRVLELGVGTGLLMFRVGPGTAEYLGTDVSGQVLETLGRRIRAGAVPLPPVRLLRREAADFTDIPRRGFDTAILNSVSQYFPTAEYLARVVEGAVEALADGGCFFVGDVRSLPTLEAFRTAIEVDNAADATPVRELRQRARRIVEEEEELVVDPAFFHALRARIPRLGAAEARVKRGAHHNELTRHRYDVLLRVGPAPKVKPAPALEWEREGLTPRALRDILSGYPAVPLAVLGIPDARVARELRIAELVRAENGPETVRELRAVLAAEERAAVDPEALWALGEELGLEVEVRPGGARGTVDALFHPPNTAAAFPPPAPADRPLRDYTSDPLWAAQARELAPRLRAWLKEQLPEYMLPSALVVLDELPLTPNGKVDRRALPAPEPPRSADEGQMTAPRTPTEEKLAELWAEVLRLERVYADDNFFDLGGHSLLATQLVTRVREAFQVELPLQRIFEAPTVAGLAEIVDQAQSQVMAGLLDELEGLTDDEVRALLEAEALHG
ncbi:MAG TPA: amino acid adenylation domain-containing protein [Longimicrobium sp.]|nr:amino acid adenylation domain-containing protein [Longimicrobium sp.]